MQSRAAPELGNPYPEGEPKRLPYHLQREREKQDRDSYMPPGYQDQEEASGTERMLDVLWPVAFWCTTLLNLANLAAVTFSMVGAYDVWKQLNACLILVACLTCMILVDKWVIRGPDGLPSTHKRPTE